MANADRYPEGADCEASASATSEPMETCKHQFPNSALNYSEGQPGVM